MLGGHPVVPLLPAHVGGQVARRVGAAELAGPHPHRVIGAATGQPMSIRAEHFKRPERSLEITRTCGPPA